MFTGIVRERGRLVRRDGGADGVRLEVEAPRTAAAAAVGDSVSLDGHPRRPCPRRRPRPAPARGGDPRAPPGGRRGQPRGRRPREVRRAAAPGRVRLEPLYVLRFRYPESYRAGDERLLLAEGEAH